MWYTLDRIENGFAVLVDEQGVELIQPASAFNFPLREGMILEKTDADDGFVLREDLQPARDLGDFDRAVPIPTSLGRLHELQVVHDDEPPARCSAQFPARLRPSFENGQARRVVDVELDVR